MGVKDLWTVLTPHAERKPISELRGKIVAIDLAGWVCESLNVVDYFVHPRHHLKNLFFRTCYLIWEEVTPVFVLEGTAPKLKSQVMEKRNEIQFRGVRPKDKPPQSQQPVNSQTSNKGGEKGRSRFNMVLKQCENLLTSMGIQCVQGPGEAEAYCAFLNQKGVDGVISQDSDCFAYGAVRVYRNFSVSSQGALAAQGGAVDIYDMRQICSKMDFGQNKVIVMALLCGCDYCPDGIGGIGRDSVIKLFNKYKNDEILNKIRCWRYEDSKYSALEMKVDDKSICANCGHMGRTQSHSKSGCGICRTNRGCNESLWKEERLSIKAELILRKKALSDPSFPSEAIIEEFLRQPKEIPKLDLRWRQPNMVKFIKQVGHLLQWKEVYCFQKFFPILTRWQVMNATRLKEMPTAVVYVATKEIVKKRVVKGIPSLEIIWQDEKGIFNGLVPESQLQEVESENPKGISDLWTTVEPTSLMETAFPEVVDAFLKSKEKPKKAAKKPRNKAKHLDSLDNLDDLMKATDEVAKTIKPKRQAKAKSATKLGLQPIDKYFKQASDKNQTPLKKEKLLLQNNQSSTPLTKNVPSDLESDEDIDHNAFNLSDIVNGIVAKGHDPFALTHHEGRQLQYETMPKDISLLLNDLDNSSFQLNSSRVQTKSSIDELDVLCEKRVLSTSFQNSTNAEAKRRSLDDSFDILVKIGSNRVEKIKNLKISTESLLDLSTKPLNVVDRFKQKQRISLNFNTNNSSIIENDIGDSNGVSYFFNSSFQTDNEDVFEKLMETSLAKCDVGDQDSLDEGEFVLLSD